MISSSNGRLRAKSMKSVDSLLDPVQALRSMALIEIELWSPYVDAVRQSRTESSVHLNNSCSDERTICGSLAYHVLLCFSPSVRSSKRFHIPALCQEILKQFDPVMWRLYRNYRIIIYLTLRTNNSCVPSPHRRATTVSFFCSTNSAIGSSAGLNLLAAGRCFLFLLDAFEAAWDFSLPWSTCHFLLEKSQQSRQDGCTVTFNTWLNSSSLCLFRLDAQTQALFGCLDVLEKFLTRPYRGAESFEISLNRLRP